MNDLEERVRADLLGATEGIDADVDTDALLASGQRARRTRSAGRVALAAALSVVVGATGWVVSQHGTRTTAPVVSASPVVAGTPSASGGARTATAVMSEGTTFNGQPGPFDSVKVVATSDGSRLRAQFTAYLDEKVVETAVVESVLDADAVGLVRLGDRGVVAVVPGVVRGQSLSGATASYSWHGRLGELGATAIVSATERPIALSKLGLAWEDGAGVLQSTEGVLPSVQVMLEGEDVVLFRSENLNEQGIWGDWSTAVTGAKPSDMLHGGAGTRDDQASGSKWRMMQFAVLPPGTADVALTLGASDGDWAQAKLPDGYVAVVAVIHSQSDKTAVVKSLAFTDADGVRHVYPSK